MVVPISNSGKAPIDIALEPEGDVFRLDVGEACELRLLLPETEELDLELEVQDGLVLLYSCAGKQVWRNGRQER